MKRVADLLPIVRHFVDPLPKSIRFPRTAFSCLNNNFNWINTDWNYILEYSIPCSCRKTHNITLIDAFINDLISSHFLAAFSKFLRSLNAMFSYPVVDCYQLWMSSTSFSEYSLPCSCRKCWRKPDPDWLINQLPRHENPPLSFSGIAWSLQPRFHTHLIIFNWIACVSCVFKMIPHDALLENIQKLDSDWLNCLQMVDSCQRQQLHGLLSFKMRFRCQ